MPSLSTLQFDHGFIERHIGPSEQDLKTMLEALGAKDLEALIGETVPENILLQQPLNLQPAVSEQQALAYIKQLAQQNTVAQCHIGMGYYPCHTPSVILRNVFENPGWYTAYTPYQPEIAQGRLEALMNFQQMVMDFTGMEMANASLLDEGTAAAEAMTLSKRSVKRNKSESYFVDENCHPQTINVIKTRANYFGFEIIVGNVETDLEQHDIFGLLVQYPNTLGAIENLKAVVAKAQDKNAIVTFASDLMALALLKTPGELGADIVVGSSQRFGVPMGFGGPHAAFFACKESYKRSLPGRIIGVSKDSEGKNAYRMALQTREQHIRREKATSNICTSQALLAVMASFYAVYHGPKGIKRIATRIAKATAMAAYALEKTGFSRINQYAFDTISLNTGSKTDALLNAALTKDINLRKVNDTTLALSFNETTTLEHLERVLAIFGAEDYLAEADANIEHLLPENLQRESEFLTHEVFNRYHSETEMLRYMKRLENKDIALNHSMISLGSCTMKLNATSEMIPVSWPEFANIHPFAPQSQTKGYQQLLQELQAQLVACTGYDAISLQPNSGAQGEYAGLLAIRAYLDANKQQHRHICLIPSSAHGTNPASAAMANFNIVIVACDKQGNIDMADLKQKVQQYQDELACIMVTYPSTHGVFEQSIREICQLIHQAGGQVYVDGANLNAMVGLAAPGEFGADVSHLNLHKTFAIPHGGGGPGMGPIGVKNHLTPFLPAHSLGTEGNVISAAPFGSASVLIISYMYIKMMGREGMRQASSVAIANANYMAKRLATVYPILYTGANNRVAHECIVDIRPLKEASGISEEDVAKRLMDYGFHSPTMSFPVPGTLMIEPTESESLEEIDRFCDSLIAIYHEIIKVQEGVWPIDNNPLVNAPHTHGLLCQDDWPYAYSREQAAYPLPALRENKFWPPVRRIDNVYGDRNLFCACPAIESYE